MTPITADVSTSNPPAGGRLVELEAVISAGLQSFVAVGNALIEIRENRLFSRTHDTFEAYCRERWGMGRNYANKIIQATEFAEALGTMVPKPTAERHVRPVLTLPAEQRASAWREAVETAPDGKPTAKHVQSVVDRRKAAPKPPTWAAEPKKPAPPPAPKLTRIDGELASDPPDIAKLRAAGKIGADVIVDYSEPVVDEHPNIQAEETDDVDMPDAEWLATLPTRAKLAPTARDRFDAAAIVYRRAEPARKSFRIAIGRVTNLAKPGALDPYSSRIRAFLRTEQPRHWRLCPAPEHGGCGGTGVDPLVGACPKCRGNGFTFY